MTPPLLELRGVGKRYQDLVALEGVDLVVGHGEVHAVMGQSGAGKSTLLRVLAGRLLHDSGTLRVDGRDVALSDAQAAQALGIREISAGLNLVPGLGVAENVFLGRQPGRFGFVDTRQQERDTGDLLAALGVELDPRAPVSSLRAPERQAVEAARALLANARLAVVDEPASAISDREADVLLGVLQRLQAHGVAIVFASQRPLEVFRFSDHISVLRDGRLVGSVETAASSAGDVVRMMTETSAADDVPLGLGEIGDVVLDVRGLTRTVSRLGSRRVLLDSVSFQMRRGEVVGLVGEGRTRGRAGAGRNGPARLRRDHPGRPGGAGPRPASGDSAGDRVRTTRSRAARADPPGGRPRSSPPPPRATSYGPLGLGPLGFGHDGAITQRLADVLRLRPPGSEQPVADMSEASQHKAALARWLSLSPKVLILDQPTLGLERDADAEVRALIRRLAERGTAVIVLSPHAADIGDLCDRVLALHEGRLAGD